MDRATPYALIQRRALLKLTVNGESFEVDDRHRETPLLWVLRDVLDLRGTKFGCGAGHCAACTVLIDGRNVKACQTPAETAVDKHVVTVEGVTGLVVNAIRDAWHTNSSKWARASTPGEDRQYLTRRSGAPDA